MEAITIIDSDYKRWVEDLSKRFRQSQIKAAVSVNSEMLRFYWELGRDIVEMHIEERWGDNVIKNLSVDLQREIPDAHCFSRTNLYYTRAFYLLYSRHQKSVPQVEGQMLPQVVAQLFSIPWGHHRYIMDLCLRRQRVPFADWRNRKLHRPAVLQPAPYFCDRQHEESNKRQS